MRILGCGLCLLLTIPELVAACSCLPLLAERAIRQENYTVFVGVNLGWDAGQSAWRYRVQRGYHNAQDGAVALIEPDSGTCGSRLDAGAVDLIYASRSGRPAAFVTGICHSTKRFDTMTRAERQILEHHRLASQSRWTWTRSATLFDGVAARVTGWLVTQPFSATVDHGAVWIDLSPIGGQRRVDLIGVGGTFLLDEPLTPTGPTGERSLILTVSQSSPDSSVTFLVPVSVDLVPTRDHTVLGTGPDSGWYPEVTFGDAQLAWRADPSGQQAMSVDGGRSGRGWILRLTPADSVDTLGYDALRLTVRLGGQVTNRPGFRARLAVQIGEGPLVSLLRDVTPPFDVSNPRWQVVQIPVDRLVKERLPRTTIKQLELVAVLDNTLWIDDIRLVHRAGGRTTAVDATVTLQTSTALGLDAAPNPFNGTTSFRLRIPDSLSGAVALFEVFDLLGQRLERFDLGPLMSGQRTVRWLTGTAASGIYIGRLSVGGQRVSRRVVLIR
jgi:hypothetical protein